MRPPAPSPAPAAATEPETVRVQPPGLHLIREPPAEIPPLLRDEAIQASKKIRTQRQTAYHFTAHLHVSAREHIAFRPIDARPQLHVPFAYRSAATELDGEIRLRGQIDPLAVAIAGETPESWIIGRVWLLALLGFAALTCPEPDHAPSRHRRSPQRARGHYRRRAAARPARARHWSAELEIRGQRGHAIPHLVVAHRRRLTGGRTASPEAIRAASQVGITLADHETWVRGHARGATTLTEAHFDWRMPEATRQLLVRLPTA